MKVSLNWIKKYVDIGLDVVELSEIIGSQLGAIETVENLGIRYEGIVIAKVVSCQPHPNADKLKICLIDDGRQNKSVERNSDGLIQVACGAPNVHAGMMVAWIAPGAKIPSSFPKAPITMEVKDIRGIKSNGMLASAKELAVSEDHRGLLEVDQGEPGDLFSKVYELDDYVIDIENKMFTHRPDCFGLLGVAREIAGIINKPFHSKDWYLKVLDEVFESSDTLSIKVDNQIPELVPRFMAVAISGVSVNSSPVIVRSYLSRVGVRPINNVVDATNYAMVVTAQPLHAYDYDRLKALDNSDEANLNVRLSKDQEHIKLLGGKEVEIPKGTIVIASSTQAIGVGGVMGGESTQVDNQTKNIVLECANFDMYTIRQTAMIMGLFTDAVTRFTKGQSPLQNDRDLAFTIKKIQKFAGGEVASQLVDLHGDLPKNRTLTIESKFINSRLGITLNTAAIAQILKNVEFEVEIKGDSIDVTAPFWRTDIAIPEDIVEEVGRLHGYDNLPISLPVRSIIPVPKNKDLELHSSLRQLLSGSGANEALTYSFVHGDLFSKVGQNKDLAFQLTNAISPDLHYYRLNLLPSLLEKVNMNLRADIVRSEDNEFALYEINKVFNKVEKDDEELPLERYDLGLVFAADAKTTKRKYSGSPYFLAKNYLKTIISAKNLDYYSVGFEPLTANDAESNPWLNELSKMFEPKRSAIIRGLNGQIYGIVGEFNSGLERQLKLPDFCAGFEIDNRLFRDNPANPKYEAMPNFPKVEQDISLKSPKKNSYSKVYDAVWSALNELKPVNTLPVLEPIDIFEPDDHKENIHISLRLWISAFDRTLKAEEVNKLLDDVAAQVKDKLGVERISSSDTP